MRPRSRMSGASHPPSHPRVLRSVPGSRSAAPPVTATLLPPLRSRSAGDGSEADEPGTARRAPRILLVDADRFMLHRLEASLMAMGYTVVSASTFETASQLLNECSPDMVVAAVRLGPFNGLHLAARSQSQCPGRPTIIVHPVADPVLIAQASVLGATFVASPLENPEFLLQVQAALLPLSSAAS